MTENNLRRICDAAKEASKVAYAQYSGLKVGAAVETEKGIFTGSNVENASYGLTICAERVAIASAVAGGARKVKKVAVYSRQKLLAPCGACLQVIREFASPDADIIICTDKKMKKMKLGRLLPLPFRL